MCLPDFNLLEMKVCGIAGGKSGIRVFCINSNDRTVCKMFVNVGKTLKFIKIIFLIFCTSGGKAIKSDSSPIKSTRAMIYKQLNSICAMA